MSSRLVTIACWLLIALPAAGAEGLEGLRDQLKTARVALDDVHAEQQAERAELATLASRIEQLKASAKGRLFSRPSLDAALKRSQELSTKLTSLAQLASARQADCDASVAALLQGLASEIATQRAQLVSLRTAEARRQRLASIRQLTAERDALRASVRAPPLPGAEPLKATDDPDELMEQVDLLRDRQEKVLKEMRRLDVRIAERRQEVDLDRRLGHFLGDQSMFDEHDSRLRLRAVTTVQGGGVGSPETGVRSFSAPGTGAAVPTDSAAPSTSGPGEPLNPNRGDLPAGTSAVDARPQLGERVPSVDWADASLETMEQERERLSQLGDQLGRSAQELEARAARSAQP